MNRDNIISLTWLLLISGVILILVLPVTMDRFVYMTDNYPYLMGFIKVAFLGVMGDLLGSRIVQGKWILRGIRIEQKFLVWGFLGIVFTVVFPLFSHGVEGVMKSGLLPGNNSRFLVAFWKSFFMNIIFAFPMMVFHRFTDNLIDNGDLFSLWPVIDTFKSINWENMFKVVGLSCLWFWIPAHTITFLLPAEFRVMSAALLAIALGFILGLAKKISLSTK